MNYKIVLSMALLATLVGCGKGKKSSGNPGTVTTQGTCSQETLDLHRELVKQSEKPITSRTRVNEIHRSCEKLQQRLGSQYCQESSGRATRDTRFLSYADVSNYCAEIQTYVSQNNPTPTPPRPVPVTPPVPNPGPRPRPDTTLVEDLNPNYALYFVKSHLSDTDLDVRNSQTRCAFNLSDRANRDLRDVRARFIATTIRLNGNSATYDMTAELSDRRELVQLTCRSHNTRLTVRDLNQLLDGVAEIRQRR